MNSKTCKWGCTVTILCITGYMFYCCIQKPAKPWQADILIVGAGLSGTVLADMYARVLNKKVLVIDKRSHIGGNCYDYIEPDTNVRCSLYGPHLFHTHNKQTFDYMHRFSKWTPYFHKVIARVDDTLVPLPVNIDTVNHLFNTSINSVINMREWLIHQQRVYLKIDNSEKMGRSRVGDVLYEKLFQDYTAKQWARSAAELDPTVLQRIPVRDDWTDLYFPTDPYQMLPSHGYTAWFETALNHPNIRVALNTDFFDLTNETYEKTFFSGPIDHFFRAAGLPLLDYRSIRFEKENIMAKPGDEVVYQTGTTVNYPQFITGNFTRITEYKHLLDQRVPHTTIIKEFSSDQGDPYYPVPDTKNRELYQQYKALADKEEVENSVYFVGRLANYKYFNMDEAVTNALQLFQRVEQIPLPMFPSAYTNADPFDTALIVCVYNNDLMALIPVIRALATYTQKLTIYVYDRNSDPTITEHQKITLIDQIQQYIPVTVYITRLRNVGREGFAWLHHLLFHPNALHAINIFKQGGMDRWGLSVQMIDQLYMSIKKTNFEPYSSYWVSRDTRWQGIDDGFKALFSVCTHFGRYFDPLYPPTETTILEYRTFISNILHCPLKDVPRTIRTIPNAVSLRGEFIATEAILSRAIHRHRPLLLEFYKRLQVSDNPPLGHHLERLWISFLLGNVSSIDCFRFCYHPGDFS